MFGVNHSIIVASDPGFEFLQDALGYRRLTTHDDGFVTFKLLVQTLGQMARMVLGSLNI